MQNSYTRRVLANRGVLVYLAALLLLVVCLIGAIGFLVDAYQQMEAVEAKISTMRQETAAYDQKKALLARAEAKPIDEEKIDEVQTGILMQLQRHHLALGKMASVSTQAKKAGKHRVYEMELLGTYDDTLAFLSSFQNDTKALVAVLSVSMAPDNQDGTLKTSVKYKVYVR